MPIMQPFQGQVRDRRVAGLEGLLGQLQGFNAGNRAYKNQYAQGLGIPMAQQQRQAYAGPSYPSNYGLPQVASVPRTRGSLETGAMPLMGNEADRALRGLAAARGRYAAGQAQQQAHIAGLPGAQGVMNPETGIYQQQYAPQASQVVLDQNAAAYGERRAADLADRRAIRRERGIAEGDARRVNRGMLTYDERLLAQQPGLGVAREMAGAQRDVAGINAGVAGKWSEAQERMATAKNALDLAVSRNDMRGKIRANRMMADAQRDAAEIQATGGLAIATEQNRGLLERGRLNREPTDLQRRQYELDERRGLMQEAEGYQAEADAYYDRGDFARAERAQQKADAARGLIPQRPMASMGGGMGLPNVGLPQGGSGAGSGIMPQSWGDFPEPLRRELMGAGPEQMVKNLRFKYPDMPQDQVDALLQSAYPGTYVSDYDRDGYGLSNFIGDMTGAETIYRWNRSRYPNLPQPPSMAPGILGPGVARTLLGF